MCASSRQIIVCTAGDSRADAHPRLIDWRHFLSLDGMGANLVDTRMILRHLYGARSLDAPLFGRSRRRRRRGEIAAQEQLENQRHIVMDETPISRGFRSRRNQQTAKDRLPPGQYVTTDFPVLSAGPTPQIKVADWTFALQLGGSLLGKWSWAEFEALPQTTIKTDIHCVTKWSKLDTTWQGVTFDDLLKAVGLAEPRAPYVMAHCDGAYTTNVPTADLVGGKGMIATRYEGLPIAPSHGGPARLLVPHLYFWKSGKWVRRLRFMEKDERGFWEPLGYHNYGDPWKEQRYDGD
jgi:DMSO/TMAO reductase YedYZ molybdopterin-dependent catalytic subunit